MRQQKRKRLVILVVGLAASIQTHVASAEISDKRRVTFAGARPAIARVRSPEGDEGASYGSGTLVGIDKKHGIVLTNWHVIRDATGQVSVEFPGGFRSNATVLLSDETWDLAALLISRPNVKPVEIAWQEPVRGDRLTIAGYGAGKYREMTGRVTQFVSPGEEHPFEMVEVDVAARQGDSGGPILNTKGRLAGVLFGSADGSTNGSHCRRVRWFVRRALAKRPRLIQAVLGLPAEILDAAVGHPK